jgi:hypothetical protein
VLYDGDEVIGGGRIEVLEPPAASETASPDRAGVLAPA